MEEEARLPQPTGSGLSDTGVMEAVCEQAVWFLRSTGASEHLHELGAWPWVQTPANPLSVWPVAGPWVLCSACVWPSKCQ